MASYSTKEEVLAEIAELHSLEAALGEGIVGCMKCHSIYNLKVDKRTKTGYEPTYRPMCYCDYDDTQDYDY